MAAAEQGLFGRLVFGRSVDNVLVDFVAEDDAVGAGEFERLGNTFHFVAAKEFARWIVRGVENNGFGVGNTRMESIL